MARPLRYPPSFRNQQARRMAQSPQPDRGRIIHVKSRIEREFSFNPTTVNVKHGWDWGQHRIPGHSSPLLSGGTGRERTISFTLRLDGDRSTSNKRRSIVGDDVDAYYDLGEFDVSDEIAFYEALTYPEPPDVEFGGVGLATIARTPPVLIFTLGSMFQRVSCVCSEVDVTVSHWTPQMEPVRADIQLTLLAYDRRTVTTYDVYPDPAIEFDIPNGEGGDR